jgi:hypothetical protein
MDCKKRYVWYILGVATRAKHVSYTEAFNIVTAQDNRLKRTLSIFN